MVDSAARKLLSASIPSAQAILVEIGAVNFRLSAVSR